MNLELDRPLCFIEATTTGFQKASDRITSLAIVKLFPDGKHLAANGLFSPGTPISDEAVERFGLVDADLKDAPFLNQHIHQLFDFIKDSDLAGFDIRGVALPFLMEEFIRENINWDLNDLRIIDTRVIHEKKDPDSFQNMVKRYAGEAVEINQPLSEKSWSSVKILDGLISTFNLPSDAVGLNDLSYRTKFPSLDIEGLILLNEEAQPIFGFGKHKFELLADHIDYVEWMKSNPQFSTQVRFIVNEILKNLKKDAVS